MRLLLLLMLCGGSLCTEETCETEKTTVTRRLPTTEDCESPKTTSTTTTTTTTTSTTTTTTTTVTRRLPTNYWYEQYLNKPCNQTSPILKNEEHDGTHVIWDWKLYRAETYFMECQEGLSDVAGAWGGYNYGGCSGVNEYGVNGSLIRFNDSVKVENLILTSAGTEVDVFGLVWACGDPPDFDWTGPPMSFDAGCWYYDDEGNYQEVDATRDNKDYEKDYVIVTLNGTAVRFYCLYNSPYGEDYSPKHVYILFEELDTSTGIITTTGNPNSNWHEEHLYAPCNESSPILKNDEHEGIRSDYIGEEVPFTFPAESYFLKCIEGLSNTSGAWGGYYYGGCVGVDEFGVNGSLIPLNISDEIFGSSRIIYAGGSVYRYGTFWECLDNVLDGEEDNHGEEQEGEEVGDRAGPPVSYTRNCWYIAQDYKLQTLRHRRYTENPDEQDYYNVTLYPGDDVRFYCLYKNRTVMEGDFIIRVENNSPEVITTTEKSYNNWQKGAYLFSPCNESSPILRNDEHQDNRASYVKGTVSPFFFPAEYYYLTCVKGLSNTSGAWGGYYYGGCIGVDEFGVNGSLIPLNISNQALGFSRVTYADASTQLYGTYWECLDNIVGVERVGPPVSYPRGCWYLDVTSTRQEITPTRYYEDDDEQYGFNVTLQDNSEVMFYCAYKNITVVDGELSLRVESVL